MHVNKILLATDLTEAARLAYPYAAGLARRCHAELILLHVDEVADFGFHSAAEYDEYIGHVAAIYPEMLEAARDEFSRMGISTSVEVVQGTPWRQILKVASDGHVDLVVVARQGARGLERLLLGSTTTRIVRHTKIPTLVVPATDAGPAPDLHVAFDRIIATTDFTPDSDRGLLHAVEFAGQLDADVLLTHVLRLPRLVPTLPGEAMMLVPDALRKEIYADVNGKLEDIVRRVGSVRVRPQVLMDFGIATALVQESSTRGALVAIPAHGKGAVRATLLGSISETVLRLSKNPVLILPHTDIALSNAA